MKPAVFSLALIAMASVAHADECHDRFSKLLINGNPDIGPTRLHITQEIGGGSTSLNYHHSDGNGNGMTEMIDPADSPWSLFLGDNMYVSNDKGQSWTFQSSFDAEKGRADSKAALTKDLVAASDLVCGTEALNGSDYDVVSGRYLSSALAGAEIYEKLWIDPETGNIVQSYRHLKMTGFESKTTQVVELSPGLELPQPD
ncbi:hypothetical protein [Planktotalea sp.]|uniref:hypothetical protein n=1 Tax=Planktotalea sp. TaxID=2029877 RepID=UPI003299B275